MHRYAFSIFDLTKDLGLGRTKIFEEIKRGVLSRTNAGGALLSSKTIIFDGYAPSQSLRRNRPSTHPPRGPVNDR